MMKKRNILIILALLLVASGSVLAGNDKVISAEELPAAALEVIKTHFPDKTIAVAKVETGITERNYDVVFISGEKLEFDKKGNWTEVDCRKGAVPAYFIPTEIAEFVSTYYYGVKIVKIEKEDRGEYEVDLSNGIELTFNKKFKLIDID